MCGFVGFLDTTISPADGCIAVARMTDTIAHRGPDSAGIWHEGEGGAYLGFRRLAIIDLSAEGHQPMASASGRYVITFNGEIYNFPDIRAELIGKGHTFRGHSDTEVLLAAIECWGLEVSLKKCCGMFALALWDTQTRTLYLARDRMGEKPLYYGWVGTSFVFGSELKAFAAHPKWQAEIDRDSVAYYLRYKYIPAPRSIYVGIRKLLPAHFAVIPPGASGTLPTPAAYWSLLEVAEQGARNAAATTPSEAVEGFEGALQQAVSRQLMSDVPLGAFLSGGIDSSTVVALMQRASNLPVKTFTIGFEEESHNEAEHALAVAKHLGTEHTELYVTPSDALSLIPNLAKIWDEPFSDASQIPSYLLAKLTREHVTVALSGDGGDELLAGYRRYDKAAAMVQKNARFPSALRTLLAAGLRTFAPVAGSQEHRVELAGRIMATNSVESLYDTLLAGWRDPEQLVIGANRIVLPVEYAEPRLNDYDRMQLLDSGRYLPDDVLVKVDRATMAVSLESRAPLLDHTVIEYVWNLPASLRRYTGDGPSQANSSKWLLRQVLYKYVPRTLIERPKKGFSVPVGIWMRGPLRDWAESLLSPELLAKQGFLRPQPIQKAWQEHLAGPRSLEPELWSVLMLNSWLESLQSTKPSYREEDAARLVASA